MHEFGWTWAQVQDMSAYVRMFTWDLLGAKREAQARKASNR